MPKHKVPYWRKGKPVIGIEVRGRFLKQVTDTKVYRIAPKDAKIHITKRPSMIQGKAKVGEALYYLTLDDYNVPPKDVFRVKLNNEDEFPYIRFTDLLTAASIPPGKVLVAQDKFDELIGSLI